jgi:hypothetical protein
MYPPHSPTLTTFISELKAGKTRKELVTKYGLHNFNKLLYSAKKNGNKMVSNIIYTLIDG